VAKCAYVLGSFILTPGNIVVVNEQLEFAGTVGIHFIYVDDGAVRDPADSADAQGGVRAQAVPESSAAAGPSTCRQPAIQPLRERR